MYASCRLEHTHATHHVQPAIGFDDIKYVCTNERYTNIVPLSKLEIEIVELCTYQTEFLEHTTNNK
jgi:hypothetical protein